MMHVMEFAMSSALSLAACSSANCCLSLVVASFNFDQTQKLLWEIFN